jgi:uncharacterized protein
MYHNGAVQVPRGLVESRTMTQANQHTPRTQLPRLDEEALVAFLATQPDIVAAYLFGSLASGRARADSDIDLAVWLPGDPDARARYRRKLQLMEAVERFADREVDVVILNNASPTLQFQVLRHGRRIYEGDRAARIDFEVYAGKVYADVKPMRDMFNRALVQEIEEGQIGERQRNRPPAAQPPAQRTGLPED